MSTTFRQIPYAIGQFTVNEFCHELAFRAMSEETKRSLSRPAKYAVSIGSGIVAGFAAAVLSQVRPCQLVSTPFPALPCLLLAPREHAPS